MLRTFFWFIYFWLYLISVLPAQFKIERLAKENNTASHDQLVDRTVKRWAQSLVSLSGSKIKVTGEENVPAERPVVFVSNHQGNFDIPILLGYIQKPKAFIAKVELAKMPMVSTWMRHMKCVFMDRSDIRQSLRTIAEAASYLQNGYSMVIFPEGTRSKGMALGEFKPGSFKLAVKAKALIVPVTIRGSYQIMEAQKFIIKPAEVEIVISKPIETKNLTKEQEALLPEQVRSIIQSNL
ncbi:1-acyl-sn-glycerol-3-phosphate acyltransferase [Syntrophobotulus glycolicus DSM 8271]|uniref:1-acyl-sn-glycerol-3-phosphate acyltransferase n=1 Tax=Syntrophobotulus glycolicus (strain DSM 8271 / FlGlyR) TaxID=645991 RepID=F0SUW0_SYNGF|nr:lysophospholipid acyltransferase family protein [Syntrophobotulus glycolicus]ADY56676.1 1-acyl-sn-glycerol-3-phosphate acyltransferase [Syntrophobotulus glycolicus DSM 8271]